MPKFRHSWVAVRYGVYKCKNCPVFKINTKDTKTGLPTAIYWECEDAYLKKDPKRMYYYAPSCVEPVKVEKATKNPQNTQLSLF